MTSPRCIQALPAVRHFGVVLLSMFLTFMAQIGMADLLSTRPDEATIREATAECQRGSAKPARQVVGLSDPNSLDPAVIDLIAETGVKWVRAEFHWSTIEAAPGSGYNWRDYDRMVALFSERGIKIQAILTYIPESIRSDWQTIDDRFQEFAEAAVRRYAPRGVHYWEVFNEPNLPGYGWLTKSEAAKDYLGAYALLLARANKAVRTNDPQGVVLLGGLASDQHRGLAAEETMRALYGLGAGACFDVMTFHPYGYQNRFPEARARIDSILALAGETGKPVWFNEYGWTDYKSMDLARNDSAATNPMIATFSQLGVTDGFFWFAAKDYSARRGTPSFGLATFELEKRPSFETFQKMIRMSRQ